MYVFIILMAAAADPPITTWSLHFSVRKKSKFCVPFKSRSWSRVVRQTTSSSFPPPFPLPFPRSLRCWKKRLSNAYHGRCPAVLLLPHNNDSVSAWSVVQEGPFLLAASDMLFPGYGMCVIWCTGERDIAIDWKGRPGAMDYWKGLSGSYLSCSRSWF